MNSRSVDTSPSPGGIEFGSITGFVSSLATSAAFIVRLAAASATGSRLCFIEANSATGFGESIVAESATQRRDITPELKISLEAMWEAARHEIIEDGMNNAVNERLPEILAKDFGAVIPALVSAIETERVPPLIAAEVLKELGRQRNVVSHLTRRWALERALTLRSPVTRDGAGLGLARLGDSGSIPFLCRVIEKESDAQTRADLRLVVDELSQR